MTTADILRAARALIATEERWTQRASARNGRGHPCNPLNGVARRFCSVGALLRTDVRYHAAREALVTACGEWPEDFNDSHTHTEVLAAFDRAIAAEEGR